MTGQLGIDGQVQPERACACGCPLSMEGKQLSAEYATDACRARHWKERTGYVKPSRENGENGRKRRSGRQVSYSKAVEAALRLVHLFVAEADPDDVLAAAEREMTRSLPVRQQRERAAA